ncbi:MAG: peptidyl-prolyl cis-trans isomerase [Bacteroidetes bacterium]|nr:peptidyl-prolyl cis-trans isomerase [Bacteroidota bacterium]
MKNLLFIFFCLFMSLFSCTDKNSDDKEKTPAVAIAGTDELSREELKENLISTGNSKDSAYMVAKTIDNWATEALFYQEALSKLNEDEIQVQREVEAYKRSLVNHIYQTKIIEANLDTNITKEEVQQYYDNNRDNFILKDNIVKVNYYKIPVKVQVLEKMKRLFYATQPKDKEQLQSLCVQYAENFFTNDSTWLYLDDIKKEIPKLKDQPDFSISYGRVFEFTDELYYYFLKIKDVKVKNGLSPINFERQNIKNFIINQRKTQLIQQYKTQLLHKAKEEKKFRVNHP